MSGHANVGQGSRAGGASTPARGWAGVSLLTLWVWMAACGATLEGELKKAATSLEGGEVEDAVSHYEAALELAEAEGAEVDPAVFVSLGRAYEDLGEPQKALAAYRRATASEAGSAEVFLAMGRIQEAQGDRRGAAASYSSALSLDPTNADIRGHLRSTLEAEGLHEAYVAALRDLATGPEDAPAFKALGLEYLAAGHRQAAVVALDTSLTLDPSQGDLHLSLGRTLLGLGDVAGASARLEAATRHAPSSVDAWRLYGHVLLRQGRPKEALVALEKAAALGGETPALVADLALAQFGQGDPKRALKMLQTATRDHPGAIEPWLALATIQLDRDQDDGAARAVEAALALDANSGDALLLLATVKARRGDLAGAEAGYRKAAAAMPASAEPQHHLCRTLLLAKKPADALVACEAALALAPADVPLLRLTGDLRIQGGDLQGGADAYEAALRAHPEDVELLIITVDQLSALGRGEEAMAVARRAEAVKGAAGIHLALVGFAHEALDQPGDALAAFEAAVAARPDSAVTQGALARHQAQAGQVASARKALAEAERRGPSTADAALARAAVDLADGKSDAALRALETVRAAHPARLSAVALSVKALDAAGRADEARRLEAHLDGDR